MGKSLLKYIGETRGTKLNPILANGIAVHHMRYIEQHVEHRLRSAAESLPPCITFVRLESTTPKEEYGETVRRKNNKRTYEIARTCVYMVKAIYCFHQGNVKEYITRFIYLPYVMDGGLLYLRGALYNISGVLHDDGISVDLDSIFVPLTCTKLTFERVIHHFYDGGTLSSDYVVWSHIYRKKPDNTSNSGRPVVRPKPSLAHYLFCKFGVRETFARYTKTDVLIGKENEMDHLDRKEWAVCTNAKISLIGTDRVAIAIKRSDYTPLVAGLVGGFFYVADAFSDRVRPEYLDGSEYETNLWRILMGHIIFSAGMSEGKLLVDVNEHIEYLDGYVDAAAQEDLAAAGLQIDDFYHLLVHIIETFPERILRATDTIGNMYGKRLSVLRYVCAPITAAAFKFTWRLRKLAGKPVLTRDDVINAMNKFLKTDMIISINREHGEVTPLSFSGDNKAINITNAIVLQAQTSGIGGSKSKTSLFDPSHQLHASIAEIGSLTHLPKSEPTGRSRMNLCASISSDGIIERDPNKVPLIDSVQEKIKR